MSSFIQDSIRDKQQKRPPALKVWIDIENSPHVLFFEPVISELKHLGHTVVTTARRFANTTALVHAKGLAAKLIGAGYDRGRTQMLKQCFWFSRVLQLRQFALPRSFDVAVSHGSRTQAVAARWLGLPAFAAMDYEHGDLRAFRTVKCLMIPELVSAAPFVSAGISAAAIHCYHGFKEDVYLANFRPGKDIRTAWGISKNQTLITFRPAADHAHYLRESGSALQHMLLERLLRISGVHVLLLPRTEAQRKMFAANYVGRTGLQIVRGVIDGPSLIYESDLVVSGGGTMVREAAVLGVPAVSCFEGRLGALDQYLVSIGKLMLIRNEHDLCEVKPVKLMRRPNPSSNSQPLASIIRGIYATAERLDLRSSNGHAV